MKETYGGLENKSIKSLEIEADCFMNQIESLPLRAKIEKAIACNDNSRY